MNRRGRVGVVVLGTLLAVALGADLLASELPLAIRVDGVTHVVPCLTRPVALEREPRAALEGRAEWVVRTPVPFGPNEMPPLEVGLERGPPPWAPDGRHWLGTDEVGRDVLARVLHGSRISLRVGLLSVLLNVLLGVGLGLLAAWRGGVVDALVSRGIEVMTTFPTVFFLLALIGLWRLEGTWALVLVLGFTRWGELARLARAEGQRVVRLDFVAAARGLGASGARVVLRHLLPNTLGPVVVAATFGVASAILLESALSFLGLGVAPPTATWGELLTEAHRTLTHPGAWWLAVFPGACIALTVGALHLVGEGLRRKLDPRA